MNRTRYILVLAAAVLIAPYLQAQSVVVSEYRNDISQDAEFTEIFVVDDNVDLRGFIVTDNRGPGDLRQSGPQFKNLDKFAHVRAGTIILFWHGARTSPQVNEDTSLADGYMEVSQSDGRFFNIIQVDGSGSATGMNLNQDRDFVQILNPDTVHVHGLGHGNPPGATWDNTPDPKTGSDTISVSGSRSVGVTGQTIEAYNAPRGKDSVSVGLASTPGLPNQINNPKILAGLTNTNKFFWLKTREPKWLNTPSITIVSQTASQHVIEWTNVDDPYPDDLSTGFLILRDTNDFVGFPNDVIVDGKIIDAGQMIGTATVIAVQSTFAGNTFVDTVGLDCGKSYMYRVYAYRFGIDDQLGQAPDSTARGRQYAPQFGMSERITKPNPPTPAISASRLEKCPGDTVTITSSLVGDFEYEWTVDGGPINVSGTTNIIVEATGTYLLKITAPGGCFAYSNPVLISSLPAPKVNVVPRGLQKICDGETITLSATTTAPAYQWLRDGVVIPGATAAEIEVSIPGNYRCRVETSDGCPGISSIVPVEFFDVEFVFSPSSIDVGQLGECQNSATSTTWLVNTGEEEITVSDIAMPADFALVLPAPGFKVRPGDSVEITIRFAPSGAGQRIDVATFTATPCNVANDLTLRGERTTALVLLDRAGVDYGIYSACSNSDIRADSSFVVTNLGADVVTIKAPLLIPPFYLLNGFTSQQLQPGEDFEIKILYRPLGADLDRGITYEVSFPFTSTSCNDTLRASLQAASFIPKLQLSETDVDLGIVLGCIGLADTLITITNSSPVEATVVSNTSTAVVVTGLPITIPPGESRSVSAVVSPTGAGGFAIRDTLRVRECSFVLPVEFSGSVFSPTFSADPDVLTLPEVLLCAGEMSSSATFVLRATGTNGLRSPILSVDVSDPFTVDITAGRTVIDSLAVTVTYTPTIDGADVDTVVVVFGPCNDTVKCVVRGSTSSSTRTVSIDNTDFGTIASGQVAQRTVTIVNTGTAPIEIAPLDNVFLPWVIASEVPTLPNTIRPLDSAVIVLSYTYEGPSRSDTMAIQSRSIGPCADTATFELTGKTRDQGVIDGITIDINDETRALIGSTVRIPVALVSQNSLEGAGLSVFTVFIRYDGTLLKMTGAVVEEGTVELVETSPGYATIDLSYTQEVGAMDTAFVIEGQTYLGASRTTPIVVDSVVVAGFDIDGDDGQLILDGECVIETQIVSIGEPPTIIAQSTGAGSVRVQFVSISDKSTNLRVSNAQGALLFSQRLNVRPGRHTITLELPGLASGVYWVTMQHDLLLKSSTFIIAK